MLRTPLLLLSLSMLVIQVGCSVEKKEQAAPVSVVRSTPEQPAAAAVDDADELRRQLARRSTEVAHLRLQLLVKEAEINQVMRYHEQALQEVVRANAKLRTLDSRADSVAKIAEASMVIDSVKQGASDDQQQTITHAENLLASGRRALDSGNYNGASYLAGKAVNLVQPLNAAPENENSTEPGEGETVFAEPLLLRAKNRSNVRTRPGTDAKVLFQLEPGQTVQAEAYRGLWIRVTAEGGGEGWVYYRLLTLPTDP